ncbi:MAG: cyclase family protein [Deltaproteobacteria bacterium]|jgi:kynurenine formamidase|nr:cyclase family protein [Deltaproteobacteria bacterium]
MPTKNVKLYDLSRTIRHGAPAYPKMGCPSINRLCSLPMEGFNAESLSMSTHTATHVDAPRHFFDEGPSVSCLPLEAFMGPGLFVDLRGRVQPDEAIDAAKLEPLVCGLEPGDFALLNTGWGPKRGFNVDYLKRWPYLDEGGARLLLELKVKAVGIDSLSLGGFGSREKARPCHEILLGAGILIIEEVFFPDEVMDGRKRLVSAFPLKIDGASASPVRLVAYDG